MGKIKMTQQSYISVIEMLRDTAYIDERKKEELVYKILTGDKSAYSEVRSLLIRMADEIGQA